MVQERKSRKTVSGVTSEKTLSPKAKASRESKTMSGKAMGRKNTPGRTMASIDKAKPVRSAVRRKFSQDAAPPVDLHIQDYERLQGMLLYSFMALRATAVPFTNEIMEMNRMSAALDPQVVADDLAERQKSAINFQSFIESFGKELFGSAKYEGEQKLAENDLFRLTHIPVKKGVEKRATMFHVGGFVPYSDNLFRLLPRANFFDRFIEKGIEVYEMKLKCDTTRYNPHMLNLSIENIIDTVHEFSDIAFKHCGNKMILEGYCGTGINTYTSYLADIESMAKKFDEIVTFVSPLDARKCTIFEQLHNILNYMNPAATSIDGNILSNMLDIIQDKGFEKTPMGALVHGWKNKEWANVSSIVDLTLRQQSELAAWYWLSLKHGGYYPLSRDLYVFYTRLFTQGVGPDGALPYEYKGKPLNLNDLKKTGIKVTVFLGGNDHLVNCQTADILKPMLGEQCEIVVHERTGHVAYIFNPNRWNKEDGRAFNPDIIETILKNLPASTKGGAEKPSAQRMAAKPDGNDKPKAKTVKKPPAKPEEKGGAAKPTARKTASASVQRARK